jgi:hypothetical protein
MDNDHAQAPAARLSFRHALALIIPFFVTGLMSGQTPLREYTLFVAADLKISQGSDFDPVIGVDRGSVLIAADGVMEAVPRKDIRNIRMDREIRLSSTKLVIGEHRAERAYSPRNDPELQAMQLQMTLQDYYADMEDLASAERQRAATAHNQLVRSGAPAQEIQASEGKLAAADAKYSDAAFETGRIADQASLLSPGGHELFDSIHARLELSAADRIQNAYVMLAVWYGLPDGSGPLRLQTYFKNIGQIDNRRKVVQFHEHGLPPGYTLERHAFHVFSGGREIPSNLSSKTTTLSETEAHQFLVLQYTTENRHQTLPATPAWPTLGQNPLAQLNAEQIAQPLYVLVDESGRVVDVTEDSSGKQRADGTIREVLHEQPFFPALDDGKPVLQRVEIRLAEWQT